jgi:hypothetical protein
MLTMTSTECERTWADQLVTEVRQFKLGVIGPRIAKTGKNIKILAPESIAQNGDVETRQENIGRTTDRHTMI